MKKLKLAALGMIMCLTFAAVTGCGNSTSDAGKTEDKVDKDNDNNDNKDNKDNRDTTNDKTDKTDAPDNGGRSVGSDIMDTVDDVGTDVVDGVTDLGEDLTGNGGNGTRTETANQ